MVFNLWMVFTSEVVSKVSCLLSFVNPFVCLLLWLHSRVTHHSITLMVAFFEPWEMCFKQNRETHILNSVSYFILGFEVLESWAFMADWFAHPLHCTSVGALDNFQWIPSNIYSLWGLFYLMSLNFPSQSRMIPRSKLGGPDPPRLLLLVFHDHLWIAEMC